MVSCSQIVQTELFDGDDGDGADDVNGDDFAADDDIDGDDFAADDDIDGDDDIDAETVSELSLNVLLFS